MQKTTPLGGLRGIEDARGSGMRSMFETGTRSAEWKVLKEVFLGPKGKKGVVWVSEPMMEVPLGEWEVVITRGAGRRSAAMLNS